MNPLKLIIEPNELELVPVHPWNVNTQWRLLRLNGCRPTTEEWRLPLREALEQLKAEGRLDYKENDYDTTPSTNDAASAPSGASAIDPARGCRASPLRDGGILPEPSVPNGPTGTGAR